MQLPSIQPMLHANKKKNPSNFQTLTLRGIDFTIKTVDDIWLFLFLSTIFMKIKKVLSKSNTQKTLNSFLMFFSLLNLALLILINVISQCIEEPSHDLEVSAVNQYGCICSKHPHKKELCQHCPILFQRTFLTRERDDLQQRLLGVDRMCFALDKKTSVVHSSIIEDV